MTEILLANLVFFIIPVCGASTFAVYIFRILRGGPAASPRLLVGGHENAHAIRRA